MLLAQPPKAQTASRAVCSPRASEGASPAAGGGGTLQVAVGCVYGHLPAGIAVSATMNEGASQRSPGSTRVQSPPIAVGNTGEGK